MFPSKEARVRTHLPIAALAAALIVLVTASSEKASRGVTEKHWVRSAFATCVRWRESRDGTASGNIYEIEDSQDHYAWLFGVPRRTQDRIAYRLWCKNGDEPWAPWDGC